MGTWPSDVISWGEPAQITQCKIDKECPICGAIRSIRGSMTMEIGLDMGYDEDGAVFGALCHVCRWGF